MTSTFGSRASGQTGSSIWPRWGSTPLNERQAKVLNRLLDGFDGKLTSGRWASIAKCSPDTALRDINDLLVRGLLRRSDAGGRSTSYQINDLPEKESPPVLIT